MSDWSAARYLTVERARLLPAEAYLAVFQAMGAAAEVWRTTYYHQLAGAEAGVDWLSATGLRPYLDALTEVERPAFRAAYLDALRAAYPPLPDGRGALRFPRLFLLARMPG